MESHTIEKIDRWLGERCDVDQEWGRLATLWADFDQTVPAHRIGKNRFSAYLQSLGHRKEINDNILWLHGVRLKREFLRLHIVAEEKAAADRLLREFDANA